MSCTMKRIEATMKARWAHATGQLYAVGGNPFARCRPV